MSLLHPELHVLCSRLSSLPGLELPHHLPTLLQYVRCCREPLSRAVGNSDPTKTDSANVLVLVHKLKTQLSTLLAGRAVEGRFVAAVLIKAVVEVGGWVMLGSAEPWVRGLLSGLVKPDPFVCKEMYILTLTKIYLMTQQYQTLVREITTPTLPAYITSCLSLASLKSSAKAPGTPYTLLETIFHSIALLMPCYSSIFRPFTSQIRSAIRPFLTPTHHEQAFVSSSLRTCSYQLSISLHQTVAKNCGGDEWTRAVRRLIRDVHVTADIVFRAVVEDWESKSGYVGIPIDIENEPSGGGDSADEFSPWNGVEAGVGRLSDLIKLLAEHFKIETPGAVAIPLSSILDIITRLLSIALPRDTSSYGSLQLNPAIGREEKEAIQAYIGAVYVAVLVLIGAVADRLNFCFVPLVRACFDHLAWLFPHGQHIQDFRLATFNITSKILKCSGSSFDQRQVAKAAPVIRSCCQDLCVDNVSCADLITPTLSGKRPTPFIGLLSKNADDYWRQLHHGASVSRPDMSALMTSASRLLPLIITYLPQQHFDVSLRSLIDRTAVLSRNKEAMLASILNPFVSKNGWTLPSILPHLTSVYGVDDTIEVLLRPRMPVLSTKAVEMALDGAVGDGLPTEGIHSHLDPSIGDGGLDSLSEVPVLLPPLSSTYPNIVSSGKKHHQLQPSAFEAHQSVFEVSSQSMPKRTPIEATTRPVYQDVAEEDVDMMPDDSSDIESVHLIMQLDTDSEDGTEPSSIQ